MEDQKIKKPRARKPKGIPAAKLRTGGRQQRRHPERYGKEAGFTPSPRTSIKHMRGSIVADDVKRVTQVTKIEAKGYRTLSFTKGWKVVSYLRAKAGQAIAHLFEMASLKQQAVKTPRKEPRVYPTNRIWPAGKVAQPGRMG